MDQIFDVALVFSPHEWVQAFHHHCTNSGTIRIRSLVYDPSILTSEKVDACIISDNHPALSAGLITCLHDVNIKVIGVCEDSDTARKFLSDIGVDAIFSSRDSTSVLSQNIQTFLTTTSTYATQDDSNLNLSRISHSLEETDDVDSLSSQKISIIGTGGSGATEFGIVLATRLIDCVLVDTDFNHPSLAPRLGCDIDVHLISAIETLQNNPDEINQHIQRESKFSVITGVSHSSYARDIKPYEIELLTTSLSNTFSHCIYDCGLISDESSFIENHKKLIQDSDVIFIVGEPTPVGVLRILETISYLTSNNGSCSSSSKICVVLNKCPKSTSTFDVINELNKIDQVDKVFSLNFVNDFYNLAWKNEVKQPKSWKKTMNEIALYIESRIGADQPIENVIELEKSAVNVDEKETILA